jgi:hypothetical protein
MRNNIDKRLEIWNKETKPLAEEIKAVFVSAETKTPSEVLNEVLEQIKCKSAVLPAS